MKKRMVLSLLIFLIYFLIPASVIHAEGKMNVAVLCGTDHAKNSSYMMEEALANNKMSKWRLDKLIPYYYDCDIRPTTCENIDTILDNAFGSSNEQDINYLYIASHTSRGTEEPGRISFKKTGLQLDTERDIVYRFSEFVEKLVTYSGQFVVILDACFAENFYTVGLERFPEEKNRFTVFCCKGVNSTAVGMFNYQFYSADMAKALSYDSAQRRCPADSDSDGFITVQELHDSVKYPSGLYAFIYWLESKPSVHGETDKNLFQFGYLEFSKKSMMLDIDDRKTGARI